MNKTQSLKQLMKFKEAHCYSGGGRDTIMFKIDDKTVFLSCWNLPKFWKPDDDAMGKRLFAGLLLDKDMYTSTMAIIFP